MSVEMDRCDSVCDVSTVGNVENAIEGGYIRVNMRVGWAVLEGRYFYIFIILLFSQFPQPRYSFKNHTNCWMEDITEVVASENKVKGL